MLVQDANFVVHSRLEASGGSDGWS